MSNPPIGWSRETIGSLCGLLNGRAFKPSDWSTEGRPIVRIQNLNDPSAKFNYYQGSDVRDRFLIDSGALLFAWSGTPGTSFGAHIWGGGPAILNQHIFNVVFDESRIDKRFFRLAINQKLEELIDKAHGGVGLRHVTKGKFEETEIDLPPLDEQRRVVANVDSLLARSKSALAELTHIPKLIARYKQAILRLAISGSLTASQRVSKGYAEWRPVCAGDLISWASGKSLPKNKQREGAIPVYGGNGVQGQHDEALVETSTLVIGRVGAQCGNVCLTSGAAWVTDNAIYAYEIDSDLLPEFACLVFDGANLNSLAGGSGQPYVSQTLLNGIEFGLPSTQEQELVCATLKERFDRINEMDIQSSRASDLLARLDRSVLAKAFRGELGNAKIPNS